ncbi:MAG: hypothetical protein JRJ26_10720 [Deltaproteobacteria bacterium]|nr:hypothetical protein [Deltaproteobacteria bacterium]
MQIPMHMETSVLLVVLLFFLISLLVNLLQHRYGRARTDRLLNEQESVRDFLARLDHSLGKVESACTFEIEGASSPKQTGKAIHIARNQIKSTISDIEKGLQSFRQYRRREKARQRRERYLEKMRKRRLGQ